MENLFKQKKVKYLAFRCDYSRLDLDEDFKRVDNPFHTDILPNGEYLVRGNKKQHHKIYWLLDSVWYITQDIRKDNGHYLCSSSRYTLYPSLSEKEWKKLNNVPITCLSKLWQRNLYGYNFAMELRNKSRKIRLEFGY